jgi:uncharacterized protein DUF5681
MARHDRETRIERLTPYRWKPGQSGNVRGRPKKEHELRSYIEGAMLNMPIAPEFYRNAMVICGMQKQIEQMDTLLQSGARLQDTRLRKIIPQVIKKLNYGEYGAMRACFEAGKNPDLFIKLVEQLYGKPIQPTAVTNPDGSPIRSPATNVLVVNVPADEDEETS